MKHLSFTQTALKWLISKVKSNNDELLEKEDRLHSLERMIVHNDFSAPLAIDNTGTILVDESGKAILADWKYRDG